MLSQRKVLDQTPSKRHWRLSKQTHVGTQQVAANDTGAAHAAFPDGVLAPP